MKKMVLIFIIPAFLVGCSRCDKQKDIAIKINNYEISKADFTEQVKTKVSGAKKEAKNEA